MLEEGLDLSRLIKLVRKVFGFTMFIARTDSRCSKHEKGEAI